MPSSTPARLYSWNVNGLRAILAKDFGSFLKDVQPDVLCLQEIKVHPEQITDFTWADGYSVIWNPAQKRGYSGTAVLTKTAPLSSSVGMSLAEHDGEGRVITLEYPEWFLVNVYTPNSQNGLRRLEYRQQWDRDFLAYVKSLETRKPVILCGDLNVAHQEIDLANPKSNRRNAGFTDEERAGFSNLLASGYIDSFRAFNSDPHHYSWWSYRSAARERNIGWRIDYWCVSEALRSRMQQAAILPHVMGSDHCPVLLEI